VLPAVILAAGDSTRMGTPKAVLTDEHGRVFVTRIARALSAAGLTDIVIVTGRHHDLIVDVLTQDGLTPVPRIVRNPDPSRGQLSSLWVAMDLVAGEAEGLLTTLVDVPMIAPSTVKAVIDVWQHTRAPIVRPVIGERHGHPVIFDRSVFEELRRTPLEVGAKAVVRAHAAEMIDVSVDDEGCLVDVDTPEDYRLHVGRVLSDPADHNST
jgi:molybdenum cofactor cytidylyltransferase